jgi:hypothetical protein
MRAPPEARIRGQNGLLAYSIKRVIFSPTTDPTLPAIKSASITPNATGIPLFGHLRSKQPMKVIAYITYSSYQESQVSDHCSSKTPFVKPVPVLFLNEFQLVK